MKPYAPRRTPERGRRIGGHAQDTQIADPYMAQQKLAEPAVCSTCGAVFHNGRWTWAPRPAMAEETTCQACHRIKDKYPAGQLTLKGAFARGHKDEILRLARHKEALENKEHPLNRIMAVEENAQSIVINTTDLHLPHRIGEALRHAFHGALDVHYDEGGYFVRATWKREA